MRTLVVNAGSSSLKVRLLDGRAVERSADVDSPADLALLLADWPRPDVVGHRIVHGGPRTGPVRIDDDVRAELAALTDLAPLHQPTSLAGLDATSAALPDVPAVACFDTAFHTTIPAAAATYAVPREWRERYAIRRYGFHGLSHAYSSRRAAAMLGRSQTGLRVVTCHLGAGASLAAVVDGRSVDTTMGFTPLEGLVMATRSGSVDPGLVLWLEEHEHLTPHDVADALEHRSGLLALAGTADMRRVEAAAGHGDADALLALDVYTHRLVAGIAAMTAAAGGLDVLVFTGGVGERSSTIHRMAAERLSWLGVAVAGSSSRTAGDRDTGDRDTGDRDISRAGAAVRTLVVAAREDLQIVEEIEAVLPASPPGAGGPPARPTTLPHQGPPRSGCAACSHEPAAHGRIGARFCAATTAGALDRGCACIDVTGASATRWPEPR